MMKLTLHLQHGPKIREHRLEIDFEHEDAGGQRIQKYSVDGEPHQADCIRIAPGVYSILLNGHSYEARIVPALSTGTKTPKLRIVTVGSRHFTVEIHDPRQRRSAHTLSDRMGPQEIVAPMPGKIVKVLAEQGQEVAQGAGLLVIEAMKMQNELRAPRAGRVTGIYVAEGAGVETGTKLVCLE